jgi:hypothetical protein
METRGTMFLAYFLAVLTGTELCSPVRNVESVMWVVAKRRTYIYYSE